MFSKFCYSLLCKDYRLLKLIFLVLASCLIMKEFYIYLAVRPTYTSNVMRKIDAEDFPSIILCPEPSIDINVAISKGYPTGNEYWSGVDYSWSSVMGWAGNKSEDVSKVSHDIATIKTPKDCPKTIIWPTDIKLTETIEFKLSNVLYPNHVCCKAINPEFLKLHPAVGMQVSFTNGSFKMFLGDQMTASYFDPHRSTSGKL